MEYIDSVELWAMDEFAGLSRPLEDEKLRYRWKTQVRIHWMELNIT